jgi:glutamine synthetase
MLGRIKNLAIMPHEFKRAMEKGVLFDSFVFDGEHSDLKLIPDIDTLTVLPWRPKSGRVIRFFCDIKNTDNTPYEGDIRRQLKITADELQKMGLQCKIGNECEFYLFDRDENGNPTLRPHDNGGYLDVAPLDKCEDVRREICLSLEEMGFEPLSSRHKYGFGQNEIDFAAKPLVEAADNMVHFRSIVKTIAANNGLFASFAPKPLEDSFGSGMHIHFNITQAGKSIFSKNPDTKEITKHGQGFIAGILKYLPEITCFLNPVEGSYQRLGSPLAPNEICWTEDDNSRLLRLCCHDDMKLKLRSADSACNPYLAYIMLLNAGISGIKENLTLLPPTEKGQPIGDATLPQDLKTALEFAKYSEFVMNHLPSQILDSFIKNTEACDDRSFLEL